MKKSTKKALALRELEAEIGTIDNAAIFPPTGDDLTDKEYFDKDEFPVFFSNNKYFVQ